MGGVGFSSGKYSVAICDQCGFKYRYINAIRDPQTNLWNCPQCGVDETDYVARVLGDRIALAHPRPDTDISIIFDPDNPDIPPIPGGDVATVDDLVNVGAGLGLLVDVIAKQGQLSTLRSSTAFLTILRAGDGLTTDFAIDLATPLSDGAMSAEDKVKLDLLDVGGGTSGGIEEAPGDNQLYGRRVPPDADGIGLWEVITSAGITDAPVIGGPYARQAAAWVELPNLVGEAPNDGFPYVRQSQGWVLDPAITAGFLPVRPTLVGPTTHALVAADINAITECNCGAGMVEITISDDVPIASGNRAPTFFKRTGAGSQPLRFTPGTSAIAGTITLPTPTFTVKVKTSGTTGVQMTAAENILQTGINIPAGQAAGVMIIYGTVAATSGVDCFSSGYSWDGIGKTWPTAQKADSNTSVRNKIYCDFIPLGNLGAAADHTWQPVWTNGNVNSYFAYFIPAYGLNQAGGVTTPQLLQVSAQTSVALSYSGVAAGENNRIVFYCVGRRNTKSTQTPSGATVDHNGRTGATNVDGEQSITLMHEAAVGGSPNTAAVDFTGQNAPSSSCVFAFVPGSSAFVLDSKGNPTPPLQTIIANHTVPVLYDPNAKQAEIQL